MVGTTVVLPTAKGEGNETHCNSDRDTLSSSRSSRSGRRSGADHDDNNNDDNNNDDDSDNESRPDHDNNDDSDNESGPDHGPNFDDADSGSVNGRRHARRWSDSRCPGSRRVGIGNCASGVRVGLPHGGHG
jgi:hypothetical protein